MLTILWILLALLLLYVLAILPRLPRRDIGELKSWDYAHRGLWNAQRPENSLSAFQAAVEGGFGIELDVHLTADGQLVVHHDDSLKRMCGLDQKVAQTTLKEIRSLRLLDTDELVPTFDEVLEAVAGRVPLMVEIKVEKGNHAPLCAAVYERMQRYHGLWCMESFQPQAVQWFRTNAPEVIRGQLAFNHVGQGKGWQGKLLNIGIASLLQNLLSRPDFVSYEAKSEKWYSLPMRVMRLARPWLSAWTVRSQKDMDALRKKYDIQIFEGFVPRKHR